MIPMTFNIGVIIGPILGKIICFSLYVAPLNTTAGGLLSNPVSQYPGMFGPGSLIGGKDGVWWMCRWPYAFPNLVSAIFLFCSVVALFFGLEEVC
jgi:hypothetical protein